MGVGPSHGGVDHGPMNHTGVAEHEGVDFSSADDEQGLTGF